MRELVLKLSYELWSRQGRMLLVALSCAIALTCLSLLMAGVSDVLANPDPPTIDGAVGVDEWDTDWIVITDTASEMTKQNACGTSNTLTPHDDPCFARTGYDLITMWVRYEPITWYVRLDLDGQPGDQDSAPGGTATDLAVGTTGDDNGPLASTDGTGMDYHEQYSLEFGDASGSRFRTAYLAPPRGSNYYIGNVYQAWDDVTGQEWGRVAYSDVVEFALPRDEIFPAGVCRDQLWMYSLVGSDNDGWSEDELSPTWKRLFYVDLLMDRVPDQPHVGDYVTYTISYVISNSNDVVNSIPVNNAHITSTVPSGTSHVEHTGGESQSGPDANGVVTWTLATPITPTVSAQETGVVTLVVQVDSEQSSVNNEAYLRMDEGLCDTDLDDFGPTAITFSSLNARTASGNWIAIGLASLGLLALVAMGITRLLARRQA